MVLLNGYLVYFVKGDSKKESENKNECADNNL